MSIFGNMITQELLQLNNIGTFQVIIKNNSAYNSEVIYSEITSDIFSLQDYKGDNTLSSILNYISEKTSKLNSDFFSSLTSIVDGKSNFKKGSIHSSSFNKLLYVEYSIHKVKLQNNETVIYGYFKDVSSTTGELETIKHSIIHSKMSFFSAFLNPNSYEHTFEFTDEIYNTLKIPELKNKFITFSDLFEFISNQNDNFKVSIIENQYNDLINGTIDSFDFEFLITNNDNTKNYSFTAVASNRDSQNYPQIISGYVSDKTAEYNLLSMLSESKYKDPVTGMMNRSKLLDDYKNGFTGTLFVIKIDMLKFIIESYSHTEYEEQLSLMSAALNIFTLRKGGKSYKYTDDIFIYVNEAVLDDAILDQVCKILDSIINDINAKNNPKILLSISTGISTSRVVGDDIYSVIRASFEAMNLNSNNKDKNYTKVDSSILGKINRRKTIEQEFISAIKYGLYTPYYQTKHCLKTNKIIGIEALARWNTSTIGQVYPDEFIPLLEANGMIDQLDLQIASYSIIEVKNIISRGLVDINNFRLSINISPITLRNTDLDSIIKNMLEANHFNGKNLDIELTEGMLDTITSKEVQKINNLSSMGISISIDDFSAGHSSLNNLNTFSFSTLKVDKGVLLSQNNDRDNIKDIYKMLVKRGIKDNFKVLSEGIETQEHADLLFDIGVSEGQGYLYTRPISFKDLLNVLQK